MSRAAAAAAAMNNRLVGLLALVLLLSISTVYSQITCETVESELMPCAAYVTGGAKKPSSECCNGVKDLDQRLKTQGDRTAVCQCIKKVLANNPYPYDPDRVSKIPKKCGLSISFPIIKPDTNCDTWAW